MDLIDFISIAVCSQLKEQLPVLFSALAGSTCECVCLGRWGWRGCADVSAMPWSERASSSPHCPQLCWKKKHSVLVWILKRHLQGWQRGTGPCPVRSVPQKPQLCAHCHAHTHCYQSKTLLPHLFAFLPPHNCNFSGWSEYLQHPLGPVFQQF